MDELTPTEREADRNAASEPETDPGHYLPQADWDSVVAEAERIRTERSEAARLERIRKLMGGPDEG